jgi:CD109 antigen
MSTALTTGEVGSVEFTIELTKVGVGEITVTGESTGFIDQVIRPLRVKPVGEKVVDLYQGRLSSGDEVSYNLTLLDELIENSENAWVKLQGGIEAAVIEGAESYIHMVSGCGEQSLSTLSIDVLAFRTVREGELDEAKLLELEMIVNQGITHELQYLLPAKNEVGRGIVWFPGDQDVHPWLTSWGVITFKDAELAGFQIDPKIIKDMQDWLLTQQRSDGSFAFPEWGLYEFNNPKLQSQTVATTAYVAHSLIYSGIDPSDDAIQDAIAYIKDKIKDDENWDDPYVLATSLKVLASGGEGRSSLATDIADQLHELRTEDNGTVFWGSATNMISNDVIEFFSPWDAWNSNPGFVIETTGYAAQALHAVGKHSGDVEGAVKYLLDHRSSLGGYFSTQDTVVAFQTIYEVSTKQAPVDIEVEIEVEGEVLWTRTMDDTNRDLTYLYDLRDHLDMVDGETEVRLRATGEGFVMFQVYLEQWIPWSDEPVYEPLELQLDYSRLVLEPGEVIVVEASVVNNQESPVKMALVELVAPVGMSFDTYEFEDLLDAGVVDNVEYQDDVVRLYINDLERDDPVVFIYTLDAELEAEVTLAGVRVFDMYNNLIEMELEPITITIGPS